MATSKGGRRAQEREQEEGGAGGEREAIAMKENLARVRFDYKHWNAFKHDLVDIMCVYYVKQMTAYR